MLQFINCQVIKYKIQSSLPMWIKEQYLFIKQLNLNETKVYKKSVDVLWKYEYYIFCNLISMKSTLKKLLDCKSYNKYEKLTL